jgi:hypothetical protein
MTAGTADAGRGQRPNAGRNPQRYRARRAQYRAERVDLRSPLYMPEIANRQNNRRSGAGERREPPIRLSRVVTGGFVPSAGLVIVCAARRRVWGTVPGDRGTASQALPG